MEENNPQSSNHELPDGQPPQKSIPEKDINNSGKKNGNALKRRQRFLNVFAPILKPFKPFGKAFISKQDIRKNAHPLYKVYAPRAESIKIVVQMLIGCILGIVVVIEGIIFLVSYIKAPSEKLIVQFNPLTIIAYGLFFSTGIDLAFMLFTPGQMRH